MITNLGVKHFYGNRNINSWPYQHRGLTGKAKYTKGPSHTCGEKLTVWLNVISMNPST